MEGASYGVLVHEKYRQPNINGFSVLLQSDSKAHEAHTTVVSELPVRLTL